MNVKKIDAACALIDQFGDRPEMIRSIIMLIWWAGDDQGRRTENREIL